MNQQQTALTRTHCVSDCRPGDEFIPGSPAAFDDDAYTQDQADSDAEDEAQRTPELLLGMLEMHISSADDLPPVDLQAWREHHYSDASVLDVRGLLALLIGGASDEAVPALYLLRERLLAESTDWIKDRAALLLAQASPEFAGVGQ